MERMASWEQLVLDLLVTMRGVGPRTAQLIIAEMALWQHMEQKTGISLWQGG